jgi:hypothetical protein
MYLPSEAAISVSEQCVIGTCCSYEKCSNELHSVIVPYISLQHATHPFLASSWRAFPPPSVVSQYFGSSAVISAADRFILNFANEK